MSYVNWIDIVILIAITLSVVTGFFRGFAKELISILVWILALWLSTNYWPVVAEYFNPYLHDKTAKMIVSFISIILLVFIAGGLFNVFFSLILNKSGLSGTDRVLGMGFGLIRGVFIVALVMLVLKMTSMTPKEQIKSSYLYVKFEPIVNWMYGFVPILMSHMQSFDSDKVADLRPDA